MTSVETFIHISRQWHYLEQFDKKKKKEAKSCFTIWLEIEFKRLTLASGSSQSSNKAWMASSCAEGKYLKNLQINWEASLFSPAFPFVAAKKERNSLSCYRAKQILTKKKTTENCEHERQKKNYFQSRDYFNYQTRKKKLVSNKVGCIRLMLYFFVPTIP